MSIKRWNRRKRMYLKKHLDFLRVGYVKMFIQDLTFAFNRRFGLNKTEEQIKGTLQRYKIRSGRICYFKKGFAPWNKNTKGLMKRNSGTFGKGNVPRNTKPLGSERIDSKDGYVYIKVTEKSPYTKSLTCYKPKHVYVWEKKHGKVPKGMILFFKDNNRLNCKLSNLTLISRSMLVRLNQKGYAKLPKELKPSVLALTKLQVKLWTLLPRTPCGALKRSRHI